MEDSNLKTLYNSLKRDNYDVPDNYDSFERTLTDDKNARRTLYNSLKRDNYDVPDSYDSFDRTLFPVSAAPQTDDTQAQVPGTTTAPNALKKQDAALAGGGKVLGGTGNTIGKLQGAAIGGAIGALAGGGYVMGKDGKLVAPTAPVQQQKQQVKQQPAQQPAQQPTAQPQAQAQVKAEPQQVKQQPAPQATAPKVKPQPQIGEGIFIPLMKNPDSLNLRNTEAFKKGWLSSPKYDKNRRFKEARAAGYKAQGAKFDKMTDAQLVAAMREEEKKLDGSTSPQALQASMNVTYIETLMAAREWGLGSVSNLNALPHMTDYKQVRSQFNKNGLVDKYEKNLKTNIDDNPLLTIGWEKIESAYMRDKQNGSVKGITDYINQALEDPKVFEEFGAYVTARMKVKSKRWNDAVREAVLDFAARVGQDPETFGKLVEQSYTDRQEYYTMLDEIGAMWKDVNASARVDAYNNTNRAFAGAPSTAQAMQGLFEEANYRRSDPVGTLVNRLLREAPNAKSWLSKRAAGYIKDGVTKDYKTAERMARRDFESIVVGKLVDMGMPKSDTGYVLATGLLNSTAGLLTRTITTGLSGKNGGKYDQIAQQELQQYGQTKASSRARVAAAVAPLAVDIVTGVGFTGPSALGQGTKNLFTKGMAQAGKRAYGLTTKAAIRRVEQNAGVRFIGSGLSGAVNFGTYTGRNTLLQQYAQTGQVDVVEAGKEGGKAAANGFVFGVVGEGMGALTNGWSGGKALLGEGATVVVEGTTFTALDAMWGDEPITKETIAKNFGMGIAGRVGHLPTYVKNVTARYRGEVGPVKNVRLSDDSYNALKDEYPVISEMLHDQSVITDISKLMKQGAPYGKKSKSKVLTVYDPTLAEGETSLWEQMGKELESMKGDSRVPWEVVRMADWVLNGTVMPEPMVMGSGVRQKEDGKYEGVVLDQNGRTITRYDLGKDEKKAGKWQSSMNDVALRNQAIVAEGLARNKSIGDALLESVKGMEVVSEDGRKLSPEEITGRFVELYNKMQSGETLSVKESELFNQVMEGAEKAHPELDIVNQVKIEIKEQRGIDIDEVMKKKPSKLTQEEKQALGYFLNEITGPDIMGAEGTEIGAAPATEEPYKLKGPDTGAVDELAKSAMVVDSRVFTEEAGGDGMVHPATLKGEGGAGYIVSGRVLTTADGQIDLDNSDSDIVIVDENGEKRMIDIHEIAELGDILDPAELKQVAANEMLGTNTPQGIEVGGRYEVSDDAGTHEVEVLRDNGNGSVEISVDGEQHTMGVEQLKQMLGIVEGDTSETLSPTTGTAQGDDNILNADNTLTPDNDMVEADADAGESGVSLRDKAAAYVDAYFPGVKGEEREGFIEQLVEQNDFENTVSADKADGINLDRVAKYEQRIAELEKEHAAENTTEDSDKDSDNGEAVEPYRIDEAADPDAISEAGFSEDNLAATVDYLNGKIDKREYLERLGFDKDVLAGIDDEKVNAWVDGVVNRASAFLTDKEAAEEANIESDETNTRTLEPSSGDGAAAAQGTTVEPEAEPEREPMPMREVGKGKNKTTEPDWQAVSPERGREWLFNESGLDSTDANEIVNNNLEAAQKAVDKASKLKPKKTTNPFALQAERERIANEQAAAQSALDYWKKVKAIEQDRQAQAAAERKAKDSEVVAQAQAEEQARQAAELAKQQEQAERGAGAVHPAIAEKWNNAPKIEGYKDEVVLANGERVPGTYYLVESGAVTPSHNASREFEKYEGFPVDENGNTINDRDYERDKDAQNITRSIADKYDSRALQTPVIVSKDGVVLSGNGRTMAGELAASNNTDGAYIEHLKNYGRKYGFSPEQVSSMKHPRAVFVPDADMPYTTETFAKFNAQEMKGQSKTEQAVKLGKVVDDATFNQIVRAINDHETLGDFYNNTRAATEAINALRKAGALNEMQYAEMFDGDAVSSTGRQIIENMLIGKAFEGNPDVIRQLTEIKSLRQSVVTALNEISTNKALGKDYSLENELAQAVDLAYKARKAGYKENEPVSPYATQLNLFPFEDGETVADYNNVAVLELADLMNDERPTQLKKKLQDYNQQSAESAAGQMDIFSGGIKDKKEIIKTALKTLHNEEQEETQRPEQRGSVADERGGEASLQENGAADTGSAALATPQAKPSIDAAIVEAGKETNTEPTDAQKEAGNYKKGHVKIDGFDVSIEQPKGSVRSGVDADGKAWSQKMNNTYGYIRGTEGVDGDHIDVFFSDNLDGWNGTVYVVDQVEKGGIFDEHKVMYGFNSEAEARKAYLSNYEDGWDGLGAITAVSKDEFKKWIDSSHRKTKPFADYKNVNVGETQEQEPKQQGTLFPATEQQPSSKSETKPRTTEKQPAEAPKERIDDVGEKIEGAKKDLAKKMGERINLDADTFPKMFPKYDLKKLISQGLDPNLAVMTKMLRQMAQADYKHYSKKRMYGKSYALRAARFYAAYAKQVLEAGDSNVDFKSEGLGFTDYGKQFVELNKRLFEELYNKLGDDLFDLDLAGVKIQPLSQKEGSTWFRRNQETGEMEPYNPAYAFVGPRGQNYYEANELDKALQEGVEQVTKSIDYKKAHPYKLGHYYKPGIKNSDYVGVKLGGKVVPLTEPMTSSEVRKYMSEHNAELQAKAAQLDEQRKLDKKKGGTGEGRWKPELTLGGGRPRVGVDRRGGVDVEPEEFRKAFSFRGVQFGNYVTQRERQRFLNEAYDALMDMAELLGISPRAIAIDGRLGFAIGARGGGKANAHYEPIENVINLTKSKGAGSLAHEWFHALDYYFNRSNKKPTGSTANKSAEQFPASTRNEMRKAFLDLMSAIKNSDYFKRSENLEMKLRSGKLDEGYYDKPTELAARAFQDYVVRKLADKGKINDFLSSFTSEEEWNGEPENYPFPIGAEAEKIDEKFDALFDAMQERTDEESNTILYHLGKEHDVLTDTEIALRDGLVDVMRSVGIDVETDEVKGQKVLDAARRAVELLDEMKKKSAPETAPLTNTGGSSADISSADGAKILQNIETLAKKYENISNYRKNFLDELAVAIGAKEEPTKKKKKDEVTSNSKYATFKTLAGTEVTIRLANHNATVSNFDNNGEQEGISIVISKRANQGITNNGNAHIVEFFYPEIGLRKAEGKPLVEIILSLGQALRSGEYKDTTGLATPQEVNGTMLQEMRGWHGSAAEFDEFDHSHMSEGEGNQAIGYGTYIASIEEIGRYYGTVAAMQKRFRAAPGYGDYDHYWKGQKIDLSSINPLRMAYDIVQREGTIKKAITMVEKFVDNPEAHEGWRSALDILRESRKSDFKRKRANYEGERYLYEVDIPENDGTNYLPWDEPLSDAMRERIAQGLRDMGVDLNEPFERRTGKADNFDFLDEQMSEHPITGQELYYKLVDRFGRYPQQASEFLNKYCGLVGIEYPSNFFSGGNKKGLKNHVIFNEKDIKIDNRTQYFISADGVVYGFVKDGKIYIDPKIATAETPIHEYCHLWGDALKEANPEAWERLKETMLGEKDVLDYVKKMYPGLEGDALVSEVFSHYSGRRGAERLRADMESEMKNAEDVFAKARVARVFDIIRRALSRFWEMARDLFAGKNANLKDLTAEDFADMAMADMLRGFDPRGVEYEPMARTTGRDIALDDRVSQREYLLSDNYVANLTGKEFAKSETPLTEKVARFYAENYGGKVERDGVGTVLLDKRSVKDSIAHGIGRNKAVAFAAVPDIIKNGAIIDRQENWKDRGYGSVTFAAPIEIANEGYVGVVVVKELLDPRDGSHRFYLHEVALQENLLSEEFKTGMVTGSKQGDVAKVLKEIVTAKENSGNVANEDAVPYGDISQGFGSADTSLNKVPSATRKIKWEPEVKYGDTFRNVEEANKYVEDLPRQWNIPKDFATYHALGSKTALEDFISRASLSKEDADVLRENYYDDDVLGCGSPDKDMVILFTEKFKSKKVLANIAAHETFHVAYKYLGRDEHNRFNNAILNWFRSQPWGDKFVEALHQSYDTSKWATETMAYFVGHEVGKYGWDKFLSGEIDYGNEEIHNFVSRFKNIITNGNISQISGEPRGKALSDVERAGQRGRQPGERGSNEQSDDRGWQRASSSLVNEEGVGYGEADDSGISDEELDAYDAGRYSFAESVTQGLVDLATKNANDYQLRMNAMREFGGNLRKLQRLMNKQKAYDKGTVDDIVRLARMVMGSGFFKDMSAYEVKRLLAAIKKGVGAENLTPIANNVVDMLVSHQLRESKAALAKLMQIKGRKVDARGIEVQAGLDIDGQRMMSALKDGMSLGENGLSTRINDCENRLDSQDEIVKKNAVSEYQGLMLAKDYHDNILSGEEEEILLREEKRQEEEKIYDFRRDPVLDDDGNAIINLDGSVRTVERKTLKSEFKTNVTEENKRKRKDVEAAIEKIEQSIRESRMERVTAYSDFISDVVGDVRASRERAAAWRDEQLKRVEEIHHNANSDLQGIDPKSQTKEKKFVPIFNPKNDLVRGLFMPLATFEKFMRFFGRRFHNGEGYLFDRYVRGMIDCEDKEWRSKHAAHEELDAKVKEVFEGKAKRWSDLFELERKKKYPTIPVEYWDNGERVRESLSQGEALSLYVWSKQKDAEAGLRRMGISEEDMETLKGQLDPKFVELADWVVSDFLPKRREYYNEVYERMFGAPMAAIENYFPIVRNSRDVEKPTDVAERDQKSTNASTITGSFIKRVRTAAALDIHTDFFDLLLKHLDDMEHIAAWAEFNRDLNTLRNYKRFKNRVSNMNSFEFGAGKDLWRAFDNCCAIVTGVYEGNAKSKLDKITLNINKGFTRGAIAFRINTALKQYLSLPAFWSDARIDDLVKYQTPIGNAIVWGWAMENVPGLSKRWQSRQVGDTRLMDTDLDWKLWRNKYMKYLERGGMWSNALVDSATCASGAKAVYEKIGYTEEQAEKKALQDAAIAYKGSQQESMGGFVSEMQVDRTFLNNMLTVFRNSPFSYGRKMTTGLRELKKRLRPGYKSDFIEAEATKMEREGIPEENAKKEARRLYRFGGLHALFDVFNYGYLLSFLWTVLGGSAWYLLFGEDDEKKEEIIKDGARRLWFSPLEGFTGGNTFADKGSLLLKYATDEDGAEKALQDFVNWSWFTTPMEGETDNFLRDVRFDEQKALWDVFSLAIQSNLGFKPETFTDGVTAIVDYCDGDPQTSKEALLCWMRVMQVPQSQVDNVYIDELGMTAKDAQKLNAMEMADRYAKYKRRKNDPLSYIAHSDDEDKIFEKYRKRFLDNMQERMMKMDDEQLGWNFDNPNDSERRKAVGKVYAKGKGVQDSAGKKPASNWKPETRRSQLKYQRLRDYNDLAEDLLLDTAIDQAKNRGDSEKLKALRDAKKELTEIRRGKHTKTIDINGLGDGSADDDKAIMEELRARRKEILREYGIIQ